nr:CFF_HP1_G0049340.mRNA.1.CDS.1 [Saccharomyces cerevisiae]
MFNFVRPKSKKTVRQFIFSEVLGNCAFSFFLSSKTHLTPFPLIRLFVNVGDWMESIILSIAIFIGVLLGTALVLSVVVALVLELVLGSGSGISVGVGTFSGSSISVGVGIFSGSSTVLELFQW